MILLLARVTIFKQVFFPLNWDGTLRWGKMRWDHGKQISAFKTMNQAKRKLRAMKLAYRSQVLLENFPKGSKRYVQLRCTRWMLFLNLTWWAEKSVDRLGVLLGQLIPSRRYIMFFQGLWQSSAWHWSRSREASSGWFEGWMDLKGMPNGFKPTKAPDEKLPFSKEQTVFELATAFAQCYLWWGRCTRIRWFQVTIQVGKEVEEKRGVGTKSKAILQHLL